MENQPESTRHLTFLKGRGAASGRFLYGLLGASEGLNAKAQNKGSSQRWMTLRLRRSLINLERQNRASAGLQLLQRAVTGREEIELVAVQRAGVSGQPVNYR